MAYIGKQPTVGNFVKLDAITTSATTTFNLTNGGVAYYPQSPNHCLVSLNGILQAPTDSFTISGSTIIFSSALTTSDVIDFIIVLGDVLNIGTPSDNTVSTAKLVDSSVTSAKVASGAVVQVVSTAKTTPFTTTSTTFTDVTGLSVSITPSSTSNKILIFINFVSSNSLGSRLQYFNLVRGSTNIAQPTSSGSSFAQYDASSDNLHNVAFHYLDSPSTTSSTTYKIQTKTNISDNTITIGDRQSGDLDSVSTITVMEIKG